MPDINEKLSNFTQIILDDAAAERDALLAETAAVRRSRLEEAEAALKQEYNAKVQSMANAISGEIGRDISRRIMADKRRITVRREEIAREVFTAVREKILAFTRTEAYPEHLKQLYVEAFSALGGAYDGVILLREEDLKYAKALTAALPGRHVTFRTGTFLLGGLIVDCQSRLLRADLSYDTALGDLDGHFAELFGLSLADD